MIILVKQLGALHLFDILNVEYFHLALQEITNNSKKNLSTGSKIKIS